MYATFTPVFCCPEKKRKAKFNGNSQARARVQNEELNGFLY